MMKRLLNKLLSRYGPWRVTRFGLLALMAGLSLLLLLEVIVPVGLGTNPTGISLDPNMIASRSVSEILQPMATEFQELTRVFRPGLFKASAGLGDKPLADRTIERIRSQLALKSILPINGELVAYIDVKGEGLKKCKTGDSVSDIFTVLRINKNGVEISIIGHKVTLGY